jgi:hypothetical protein
MCTTPRAEAEVTVRATPTKYPVSKGSADNIVKLSNSQTNYTYTLYKDGVAVSNSNKVGKTGSELEWTLSEDGTYTVKARYTGSTCTETEMSGSYEYISCTSAKVTISNWNISTLCPGSSGTFTYTAAQGATVTWKMYQNNSDYIIVSNN